ncbi:MAG TPA: tryptophan synthase subunit alpha, partial [Chloroflexota bacterium]|nr:tryptophan synthase subunit alpha [Chloroflexota bacterium]
MGRIAATFERTRRAGRIALMPYLALGYPTIEATLELAPALVAAGANFFELGVPYSDPLADGATVQRATQIALKNGVTPRSCLDLAAKIREKVEIPLVLMSYYNPIAHSGGADYIRMAAEAGVDGLIVPDLPPEEAHEFRAAAIENGLDLIFLVAPTSTDARLELVGRVARGFVYCVALSGVTGARATLSADLPSYLERVRKYTDLPLAIGFGISRPEHVHAVAPFVDGAIV